MEETRLRGLTHAKSNISGESLDWVEMEETRLRGLTQCGKLHHIPFNSGRNGRNPIKGIDTLDDKDKCPA